MKIMLSFIFTSPHNSTGILLLLGKVMLVLLVRLELIKRLALKQTCFVAPEQSKACHFQQEEIDKHIPVQWLFLNLPEASELLAVVVLNLVDNRSTKCWH